MLSVTEPKLDELVIVVPVEMLPKTVGLLRLLDPCHVLGAWQLDVVPVEVFGSACCLRIGALFCVLLPSKRVFELVPVTVRL